MQLDKMTVNIRPLPAYQAIDLGLSVARRWYGRLISLWLRRAVVIGVILTVLLIGTHYIQPEGVTAMSSIAGFFLWWLKPYFEAPLLLFLSKQLFDTDKSTLDQSEWQRVSLFRLGGILTRHRLSVKRQSVMAVSLLEQRRGQAHSHRLKLLSRRDNNAHLMHTWVFFHVEAILYFGVTMVAMQVISPPVAGGFKLNWIELLTVMPLWLTIFMLWLSLMVFAVIAPFFVASGFVMYLCKRSLLEAWDVELMFRKLADRHAYLSSQKDRHATNIDTGGDR